MGWSWSRSVHRSLGRRSARWGDHAGERGRTRQHIPDLSASQNGYRLEPESGRNPMRKSILLIFVVGAVFLLSVVVFEFREGAFSSSLASPPEASAPLQSAGESINYNFDSDNAG